MNKSQVMKLFLIIQNCYSGFAIDEEGVKADTWADLLRDVPFELAQRNLRKHIMTDKFPPTIADLSRRPETEAEGRYIPNAEKTRRMLDEQYREFRKLKLAPPPNRGDVG